MNRILRTLLICTIVFASSTMHAAQVSKMVEPNAKVDEVEPFILENMENYFIVYRDRISAYNKINLFVEVTKSSTPTQRLAGAMNDQHYNEMCIQYDENNSDKRLTGDAEKEALNQIKHELLPKLLRRQNRRLFKEVIHICDININTLTITKMSYLVYAILNHLAEMTQTLIALNADVNHPYQSTTPVAWAICCDQPPAIKQLLLAGANIMTLSPGAADQLSLDLQAKAIVAEVYNAREAEQGAVPQLTKQKVGSGTTLTKMIISYLLGDNHKVCAIKKLQ